MRTLQERVAGKFPIDPLVARLRNVGLRLTAQRLGVLQALKTSHSHPTVEDLYRQVRKRFPNISLNTVYLNLEALTRAGETSEVWIGHDAARFEPNSVPHDQMPRRLAMRFDVIRHRVDFFGVCKTCQVRRRREQPRSYRGT